MSGHLLEIGALGAIGLVVIGLAMIVWIAMVRWASREPTTSRSRGQGADRGDNAGGVVRGSPAQQTRRDEAHRTG